MTGLTAYNNDVQRIFRGGYCTKTKKREIISAIEEKVFEMGKSFSRLFPNKKGVVLDNIIFLLSGTGICTIGADKLAENAGCSIRTVKGAVASLKETDQILVARLANGNAGKYIFVYKQHPNFQQILREVFFIESLPETDEIASPIAPQITPLENPESHEAVSVEGEKSSSNYINLFNSIQEKDSIQQAIENDVETSENKPSSLDEQRKKIMAYGANENQLWFFDTVSDINPPEQVKNVAGVLALRLGTDATPHKAHKGFKLASKIAVNIMNGVTIESVPAVFSEGLKHPLNRYEATEDIQTSNLKQTDRKLLKIDPQVEFRKYIERQI